MKTEYRYTKDRLYKGTVEKTVFFMEPFCNFIYEVARVNKKLQDRNGNVIMKGEIVLSEGIVYQNKDIEFKLLSETFREKSFEAYGLDLPRIKEVLPTNLPSVEANEKRMDNLFLLEDDTIAIVDYESEDKKSNQIKYVNYIGRVMQRYYKEDKKIPNLRMIVIYTGDVEKADAILETECFTLHMEQVFVHNLPQEEIYQSIKEKLQNKKCLTEQELMQLIILPLAEKGKKNKQRRIEQVVELAKLIKDEREQTFVIAGILVSSDKFIDREYAKTVRRYLSMTKVFQILEEEKQEAINKAEKEMKKEIVRKMLQENVDMILIMKVTGLTRAEIEEIRKSVLGSN